MSIYKSIGGVVKTVVIFGGLLFLPAGTLDWRRAWVLLGAVLIGTVAARILIEERFLRRELAGYDNYARRVRYRLIPWVW